MRELLKKYIDSHISLFSSEMESFCNLFHRKDIKKKSFLLKKGEICKFEGFVVKGLLRMYHIDSNGAELVLNFALQNSWITDIESFNSEKPSEFYIEALEESVVLLISKADKEFACESMPKIEKLFTIMTQKTYVALQSRMIDILSKNAYQRYMDFVEQFPNHYQKIPSIHTASYLGLSREYLSKMRGKIAVKKLIAKL